MNYDILKFSPAEYQAFLHDRIPPARCMGIEVLRFDDEEIRLKIPMKLNHNDKMTAFAGSINSLLTLCGWSRILRTIRKFDPDSELVIGKSAVTFRRPMTTDLEAFCGPLPQDNERKFLETYDVQGKARYELLLSLSDSSGQTGQEKQAGVFFSGIYMAYRKHRE